MAQLGESLVPAPQVPRLALRPEEAAFACGCSRDFFDEHIGHELAWIRRGRLKIVSVAELEKWLASNASRVFEEPLVGR